MKELETVSAVLDIEMFVACPNKGCDFYIDLLKEKDTNGVDHDEDSYLLKQMFPSRGSHDDFECEEVTCSRCKTVFNVEGLEW